MTGEQIAASDRARHALGLRRRGFTFRAIARRLDVSVSTAHGYVSEALADLRREASESAAELRQIEADRLDALTLRLWKALRGSSPGDCARLALALLRVSESRRKLIGLDAPTEVKMTGNMYVVKDASPDTAAWGEPNDQGANHAAA